MCRLLKWQRYFLIRNMFSVFISLREKKYLIVFTKQFKFASPCIKDLAYEFFGKRTVLL